ncbi:protein FAM32A-like [Haliotis rubra]|uniref:protein FAM32A-like n=1 Tax=Haliotis rubra TaxID=36100 RepID=UPI001EE50ECB|nr:protein FAM32A-like [Haliotis rubra]
MSAYDSVQTGGLNLKGVSDHSIKKKKKKKSKDKDKEKQLLELSLENEGKGQTSPTTSTPRMYVAKKTKAELAFEKVKEKRQAEQILEKASTSHKEQIMKLNKHLDTLTEHFDIPKVSWTK